MQIKMAILVSFALLAMIVHGCRNQAGPATAGVSQNPQPQQVVKEPEVEVAPPLVVTDLEENTLALAKSRGKVIVLYFWATYCKPCVEKFDGINAIHEAYVGKNVEVWALSEDPDARMVESWLTRHDLTMPVALVGQEENEMFFPGEKLLPIPQVVVVDQDGKIARRLGPEFTLEELETTVKQLIGEAE
jgi:peroxiredoxin